MIIVGQDGLEIINFDNVMNIEVTNCDEDGFGIFAGVIIGIDDNYRSLGYYKTEERAKEVLEYMANAYANMQMIKIPNIIIHEKITAKEMARNICFIMPKD